MSLGSDEPSLADDWRGCRRLQRGRVGSAANAARDGLRHWTQYAIHIHSTYMSDRGSRPKCAAPIRIVKLFSTLSDNFIYCQTFLCADSCINHAPTLTPPSPTSPDSAACPHPSRVPVPCDMPAIAAPPRAGLATAGHSARAGGSRAGRRPP